MQAAIAEARAGLAEGGIPIGAVLVRDGLIMGRGRNRRIQHDDPIGHAETDCLRNAGRIGNYTNAVLYSTMMPCHLCAGAVIYLGIKQVVVAEADTFDGAGTRELMRAHGVEVNIMDLEVCRRLIGDYIRNNPETWAEEQFNG
jgi:creatinine deaminase